MVESQTSAEVWLIPVVRLGQNRNKERKLRPPVKRKEFFENKIWLRFWVPITPLLLLFMYELRNCKYKKNRRNVFAFRPLVWGNSDQGWMDRETNQIKSE